jgi:type II secretory pathway pseudopilin PulG
MSPHKTRRGFSALVIILIIILIVGVIVIVGIIGITLLPNILGAPSKARDASRKAQLSMLSTAIENAKVKDDKYPEKSVCVEELESTIKNYLNDGKMPVDPAGTQTFGSITCASGYYYQSFGDKGYILWAKMDDQTDGTTSSTPEEYAKQVDSGIYTTDTSSRKGNYYLLETITEPAKQPANPDKALDATRKADLNTLTTALEANNLETGKYTDKSSCIEDIETELKTYLQGGKIPTDSMGPQTFDMATCQSGYYYQSFGDKGYALWAKMDDPANGNISVSPVELERAISAGKVPALESSGAYYIKNESSIKFGTSITTTTTQKPKVKRAP